MYFKTVRGNRVNVPMDQYKLNVRSNSLSQFQRRTKLFFKRSYPALDWYEEVPLVGEGLWRMRWDFVLVLGVEDYVFIECQGGHHLKINPKFQKTMESFDDQLLRDHLKAEYAAINSKHPLVEIFEEDEPLTVRWLEKTYPNVFPNKKP